MQSYAQKSPTLQELNDVFNLDWNDYRTILQNKKKIDDIDAAIKDAAPKDEKERHALAMLCYKIATYDIHVARQPELALEKLLIAEEILEGKELDWAKNHIAYCYEQKLYHLIVENDEAKPDELKNKVMQYCDEIISRYTKIEKPDIESIKILAFANCVRGLMHYEVGQFDKAIEDYELAIKLYEEHGLHDDQSARAKCRYAQILGVQGKLAQANAVFEKLDAYWSEKPIGLNPYQARFFVSYADYLMNTQSDKKVRALKNFKKAYEIVSQTEDAQSQFAAELNTRIAELLRILNPVEPNVFSETSSALLFQPAPPANTAQVSQPVVNPGSPGVGLGNGGTG